MNNKKLTNPPIVEALIELRFSPNNQVTLEQLENFAELESNRYPTRERIHAKNVEISAKYDTYPSGFRLKNIDENRIIACTIDRLVVTFKPPYISWPTLQKAAQTAFSNYSNHVSHGKLTRIGMRYINKIKIPLQSELDFEQYINTMPKMPKIEGIPETIQSFETLLVIPFQDIPSGAATVKQVLLPPETGRNQTKTLPFILDIDIFCELENNFKDSSIWTLFNKFHEKKNKLFFASLTEKTLEMYMMRALARIPDDFCLDNTHQYRSGDAVTELKYEIPERSNASGESNQSSRTPSQQALIDTLQLVYDNAKKEGWDGDGATPVAYATWLNSSRLIDRLCNVPNPEINADNDGYIEFEWYNNRRTFSLVRF